MKLKEYRDKLNKLVKQGHGDKDVYYSCDDEGNSYQPVFYSPCVRKLDENNEAVGTSWRMTSSTPLRCDSKVVKEVVLIN